MTEAVETTDERKGLLARLRTRRPSCAGDRSSMKGFTLIELIVVVTIIGILASVAIVNVRTAQQKAREAALKDNLASLRKSIDAFYADKQRFPANLEELVPGYMRKIPSDPITNQTDWELIMEDPMAEDALSSSTDPNAFQEPGVVDVKSRAEGVTLDNVPYADL